METADSFKTLYATQYGDVVKKSGATELVWKDVTVKSKTGTVLLDGVSGSVCGRLLGVLGPSGSGKTTLLNQLSLRTQGVEMIGGEQLMNGVPYSKQDVQSLTSYVLQDDLLFSNLTVEECLEFAADMLMHPRATKLDKNRRVKKLLSLLDLSECKDVIIGSPLEKGISGGQRKRCSVGMALINRPSVVFLDEPTTGLDSETSFGLVHSLKGLAVKEKVTVVATIHQPSSAIVSLFDDLLILDHGRVMYHGPQNLASAHFARAGYPCPPRMNTVEWFLEVVSSDDGREKLLSLPDRGLCSVVGGKSGAEQKVDVEEDQDAIDMDDFSRQLPEPTKRINVFRQFQVLLLRSLKLSFRDRLLVFIQLFQTTLMALLIGAAYYQLPNIQSNIATRRASLFFCVVNQGVFGAMMTINIFPSERQGGMYSIVSYFLAKNVAEVMLQAVYPVIFSVIVYWMVGYSPTPQQFFIFLGFMELCMFTANSVALVISVSVESVVMAAAVLPLAIEIARLFGGFFMAPAGLPLYFSWITAVSYCLYVYSGLLLNEFTNLIIGGCVPGQACQTGNQMLDALGFGYVPLYACALVLLGLVLVLRTIAFVVLHRRP